MRGDTGSERVPSALSGDAPRIRMDGTVVLSLCLRGGALGLMNEEGWAVRRSPGLVHSL